MNEFTIESNPGEFDLQKMRNFRSLGVNRISLGFQSLNNEILKTLSRWHTKEDCFQSYKNARKAGFKNINIDIMFGVPKQSFLEWKNDLDEIINLNPEHISTYSLTIEKNTPLYNDINSKTTTIPHEKSIFRWSH